MHVHTVSDVVDAPPDAVFATVTDPARLPDWNDAIVRVLEAPPVLTAGAEWVVEMQAMGRHWRSRARVEDLDPSARRFAYRSQTDDGNPSYGLWSWTIAPSVDGRRTLVTVRFELHPATFWRRVLLVHVRARQLARTEVPASIAALGRAAAPA